jgi:hypothetical protein
MDKEDDDSPPGSECCCSSFFSSFTYISLIGIFTVLGSHLFAPGTGIWRHLIFPCQNLILYDQIAPLDCLKDYYPDNFDTTPLPFSPPTENCDGGIAILNYMIENYGRHKHKTFITVQTGHGSDNDDLCPAVLKYLSANHSLEFTVIRDEPLPPNNDEPRLYKRMFADTWMPDFNHSGTKNLCAPLVMAFSPKILRPKQELIFMRDRILSSKAENRVCGDLIKLNWHRILTNKTVG